MSQFISEKSAFYGQREIMLLGDSIFDNQPYVAEGESVSSQLQALTDQQTKVHLLAVDGAVMANIPNQLDKMLILQKDIPEILRETHVFVSCGGNDLLGYAYQGLLEQPTHNIGSALISLDKLREDFRTQYQSMLNSIVKQCGEVTVCTIYDSIPNLPIAEKMALSLFNEVILQEAKKFDLAIIDLRILCNEQKDYSEISPIEPSKQGASKIAAAIHQHIFKERYDACAS